MGIRTIIAKIRTAYYRKRFKLKIGKNTLFLGKVDIYSQGNIKIGDNCTISSWSVINQYGGNITIGDDCSINSFCHISGNGGVEIGNKVRIATQCVIVSANHNYSLLDTPIMEQGETAKKIIIEDNCWLGAGVKVLSGVTIGSGSVIGAGAVVNKNISPHSVAVGIPAKVIKKIG